jgi:hypothetical protein
MPALKYTVFVAILLTAFSTNSALARVTIQEAIDDQTCTPEGRPHGVPYGWATCPLMALGNNAEGYDQIIAWGQLYESLEGNPATNSGVELRNLRLYLLSKTTGVWLLVEEGPVKGARYPESFRGQVLPADVIPTADGTQIVTAGDGYNFHFWTAMGRTAIDPADIGGVYAVMEARLVTLDPSQPDDRDTARYVLDIGADYWSEGRINKAVGMGRFKFVTEQWRAFHFSTAPAHTLWSNPPGI